MPAQRFSKAILDQVIQLIDQKDTTVYNEDQLKQFIEEVMNELEISDATVHTAFKRLLSMNHLRRLLIQFSGKRGKKKVEKEYQRFANKDANKYQIIASIAKHSYFSHQTALYFNNIASSMTNTIYLSHEQSYKENPGSTLKQENIDSAFLQPVRTPRMTGKFQSKEIILHNGKFTNDAGVVFHPEFNVRYTSLERTLLDITVRPNYAGGVKSVLKAFKKAKPLLNTKTIISLLDDVDYIYPYHQALGFYLDSAGYEWKEFAVLEERPKELDFYLAHKMGRIDYSERWKLYFPEGLI